MGFREELITSWKGKTIEYQGKTFYIYEEIEFRNKTFLYAVEKNSINEKGPLKVAFLYKIKDSTFGTIEDEELVNILYDQVNIKRFGKKAGKIQIKNKTEKEKKETNEAEKEEEIIEKYNNEIEELYKKTTIGQKSE